MSFSAEQRNIVRMSRKLRITPTVSASVTLTAASSLPAAPTLQSIVILPDNMLYLQSQNVLYQLLSGGLILGAFFMATDYVTSPVSPWGRVIMGVGCALVLFVIRVYNPSYPEGCSFAILFMNVLTPLIDKLTAPKPFGAVKPARAGKEA